MSATAPIVVIGSPGERGDPIEAAGAHPMSIRRFRGPADRALVRGDRSAERSPDIVT